MKKHHLLYVVVLAILSLFFAQISFGEPEQTKTQKGAIKFANKVNPDETNPGALLKAHKNCRREFIRAKKECGRKKGNDLMKCKSEIMEMDEICANTGAKKHEQSEHRNMSKEGK